MTRVVNLSEKKAASAFLIAWAVGLIFYFLEYAVRSSPGVMIPQLANSFQLSTLAVSSLLVMYYYTYSAVSLIAGIALDRQGARMPVTTGIFLLGIGCLMFASSAILTGDAGRLLQGAGSAFAFPGCVFLATHGFSKERLATAIGFTQCFGMLGGSAGQFVVSPLIQQGFRVQSFWIIMGIVCLVLTVVLFFVIPKEQSKPHAQSEKRKGLLVPYKIVFGNPQSYLCGLVSGLLFAPTTIFAMTWGVAFFEHDRGFNYRAASIASSMVPLGWVVGCPLLGWLADKTGRRKPVLIGGCVLMILSLLQLVLVPGLMPAGVTLFVLGTASGVAMLPYSIIKEVNPNEVKGSATGAINFLTFGVTSLLGPLFASLHGKTLETTSDADYHFQRAGIFWIATTLLAILISLLLKETGRAARTTSP